MGFEPTVPGGHNGFRDRPIQPLSHLSETNNGTKYTGEAQRFFPQGTTFVARPSDSTALAPLQKPLNLMVNKNKSKTIWGK